MSSPSSSSLSPQVSFAVHTVHEYLNTASPVFVLSWLSAFLHFIFVMVALPLFLSALAVYTIHTAHAWENHSSGQISGSPIRYNRVRWSSLPVLPRIEAVLTWNWYQPPARRGKLV